MRHLRRFLPVRGGYGPYPACIVCINQRRNERRRLEKQHTLVLCILLLLHGALPSGSPHNRYHVYLKRLAVKEGHFDDSKAPDFSKTFIFWVENYGRSFELGLMGTHMIRHNPFGAFKIAGMGIGMVTKGRMDFTPTRIKDIDGLKAILAKAKELEVAK